jgi:hypothetical protein
MMKRAVAAWVLLSVLMVINGVVREFGYGPGMDAYTANVISTATGIVVIFALAYFFMRTEQITPGTEAWKVGAMWAVLTVVFELGLGYARGLRSADLLAAYNIADGQVWLVLVLSAAVAPPFWAHHFRFLKNRPDPRVHFPLIRL